MGSRAWEFFGHHKRWLIGGSAVIGVVCGVIGWMITPGMDAWTAVYRSLQLFVLDGPTETDISPWLNLARFVAPVATSVAIVAVGVEILRGRVAVTRAKRQRGHTVVLGDGPEAVEIAHRMREGRTRAVVAIGELAASDVAELHRDGVIHLPSADEVTLGRILDGAERAVISASDDSRALAWMARARCLDDDVALSVIVLLSSRELAADWRHSGVGTVLCRSTHLATAVLRECAPYAEDAVVPSPVVIGEGHLATELARRIIEGWQRSGECLAVHCVGPDQSWAELAEVGLEGRAHVEWHRIHANPYTAVQAVRTTLQRWLPFKPDRYEAAPARVYVTFEDDTVTAPIANAVARELSGDTLVVAILDDPDLAQIRQDGVRVIGSQELLCDPASLTRTLADDLADEIVADLGRWPADTPSVFGAIERTPGSAAVLDGQVPEVGKAIDEVARNARSILERAGLAVAAGLTGRPEAQILDPAELVAVAEGLQACLSAPSGVVGGAERRAGLLELAAVLPVFFRRVGCSIVRANGRPDLLSADDIMTLAMSAHRQYLVVAEETANASGSRFAVAGWEELTEHERRSNVAQVLDIPVKLAMIGLGWQKTTTPVSPGEPDGAPPAFTEAEVEFLAEQEHRRWAHFEMRNARHDHAWNQPWSAIKGTGLADYDAGVVRWIPSHLAHVGLRTTSLDQQALVDAPAVVTRPARGDARLRSRYPQADGSR